VILNTEKVIKVLREFPWKLG